mmetsp:Transcript_93216/g.237118  ORF Transcript_93216/g.237118 Transcript_93216/m.237118 type:complete len:131 (-) Transcript_93216:237-629(-)
MPSGKTLTAMAAWYARMCGAFHPQKANSPGATGDVPRPQWTKPSETSAEGEKRIPILQKAEQRNVHIDSDTTVPYDLYRDLVRAGREAKTRGQHELQEVNKTMSVSRTLSLSRPAERRTERHLVRASNSW